MQDIEATGVRVLTLAQQSSWRSKGSMRSRQDLALSCVVLLTDPMWCPDLHYRSGEYLERARYRIAQELRPHSYPRQLESRADAINVTVARRALMPGTPHLSRRTWRNFSTRQTVKLHVLGLATFAFRWTSSAPSGSPRPL